MTQNALADTSAQAQWTTDFTQIAACDVVVICVPTLLSQNREPDLSDVEDTARVIAQHLTKETLVVLGQDILSDIPPNAKILETQASTPGPSQVTRRKSKP